MAATSVNAQHLLRFTVEAIVCDEGAQSDWHLGRGKANVTIFHLTGIVLYDILFLVAFICFYGGIVCL